MTDSAGLLPYRRNERGPLEVLIAHPGGPLWARKDAGAWSVIKGEIEPGEATADAARREFSEETGWEVPAASLVDLGLVTQRSGKRVHAWAMEAPFDPDTLRPGVFRMVWPPRSGRSAEFPEIDRVAWCAVAEARRLLNPAQVAFVDRLEALLSGT